MLRPDKREPFLALGSAQRAGEQLRPGLPEKNAMFVPRPSSLPPRQRLGGFSRRPIPDRSLCGFSIFCIIIMLMCKDALSEEGDRTFRELADQYWNSGAE